MCVCTCVCILYLQLDLLELVISPAVVQAGLTQLLCVWHAMLWTDLVVEVSLSRAVAIIQLDRIRHWLM